MTPKEKADYFINRLQTNPLLFQMPDKDDAIIYAKIMVDEIINAIPMYTGGVNPKYLYWKEVKIELENL